MGQAITLLMEQADNDEYQAMVYKDAKQKKEFRHFYKLAAVNRRAADILCEMLSLTQSAVDGAQGDCARCGQTHYDGVEKECHRKDCDFKERNRLKREKRSVSGNADGLGRRTLDADSK